MENPSVRPRVSVVTPAYNEAENLPLLYRELRNVLDGMPIDWEWLVVDDHSSDTTFGVLAELSQRDPRVRALRFARNSGSHLACTCGLQEASGDCAVIMAADLQDPPETIPKLFERWRAGVQVVWAVRAARLGEKASTIALSRLFNWFLRRFTGMRDLPAADFFLVDRRVLDAFRQFEESNTGIMTLIAWMGFRQESLLYVKEARAHGVSKWSLEKKLKLAVDCITSFTYLPIRYMSYAGLIVALLGFLYAGAVLVNAFRGHPIQGWTSLIVVVLVLGGMQMVMMGILGEYLWRALDESRRRPRYLIEGTVGQSPARQDQNAAPPV
jgi:dolichol-phosphate mannosyltransferase